MAYRFLGPWHVWRATKRDSRPDAEVLLYICAASDHHHHGISAVDQIIGKRSNKEAPYFAFFVGGQNRMSFDGRC